MTGAEVVMGPPRHLSLFPDLTAETIEWPVPFADGLPILEGLRGRQVVVLASGDPFWFGAGAVLARKFGADEWHALPGPSVFSLAAARLGWPLERTLCLGLHAQPLTRLRPYLAPGTRAIVLLRDGGAVTRLARYLVAQDFGETEMHVLEALGGPREKITNLPADTVADTGFQAPVALALKVAGPGKALPKASGIDDTFFDHDGQITKRPVRALALSALAPKPGERLWDIGGGSGSIAIEWLLSHDSTQAVSIERDPARAARIRANADALGVDRLQVVEGTAPDALTDLLTPDAVFIGGGLSEALLAALTARLAPNTRIVAHAVTLDSEALLTRWYAERGGDLMRIELAHAAPLGGKRGWKASYPIVQWRVTL